MKLLIVQTGFLGDVVLSSPVIPALNRIFPDATISFLTTPQGEEILSSCLEEFPYMEKIICFDKRGEQTGIGGIREMAAILARENFDAVFSLHKSWRTAALLWWAGIPRRFGFREAKGKFLYTATAVRSDLLHEVLRNLAILRNVGHEPLADGARMFVGLDAPVKLAVAQLLEPLEGKRIVAMAPGSVWPTKRWSEQGFRQVARELANSGYGIVILGGKEEAALGERIAAETDGRAINLAGQISIKQSAAVISKSAVLIANDSLPLHLASAVNTPVVALFCSTVPEFGFGPWGIRSKILGVSSLPCRPCGRHGRKLCPIGSYDCINKLTWQVVCDAVGELVNENK